MSVVQGGVEATLEVPVQCQGTECHDEWQIVPARLLSICMGVGAVAGSPW